ncbi:MAG: FliI/YscN family ATPase [Planctomycetes bacterium]|nr:FliI/YscN family ATPase [Planctomycetota bacterium]
MPVSEEAFLDEIPRLVGLIPARISGTIQKVIGLTAEVRGLGVPIGSLCEVNAREARRTFSAEVVGFRDDRTLVMPHEEFQGVAPGDRVSLVSRYPQVPVGDALLGRVLGGTGEPVDGKGPLYLTEKRPVHAAPPRALERPRIREPLATGVTVLDALLTTGRGQRVGLFSGSGVGKSVLMGMIARNTESDVTVIALVGERGREVREFIERDLGPEGLARSVLVVATSDASALLRVRAAFVATTVAEYFRDRGKDVLLMMDSVTRFALAQREIGLSAGEPPATRGFPPSAFSLLPRLLERAGRSAQGSITGIYTVLVEGDDMAEPVSDAVRGTLDGHIVLARELAHRGHYPAVDPLQSISRLMVEVATPEHLRAAQDVLAMLATHREAEDLIQIGAYVAGSNPEVDRAIRKMPEIRALLRQGIQERRAFQDSVRVLQAVGDGQ